MPTTRPFPQSLAFPGCCKPGSDIPLEQAVAKFYDYFRETYIRESNGHAPDTGLVPDFIIGDPPQPARANFLERSTDGAFSWNACRIPLRLAADFAHYGTPESQAILLGMTRWLRGITQENPMAIHHGYTLNGDKVEFEVKSLERARMTFRLPCWRVAWSTARRRNS